MRSPQSLELGSGICSRSCGIEWLFMVSVGLFFAKALHVLFDSYDMIGSPSMRMILARRHWKLLVDPGNFNLGT